MADFEVTTGVDWGEVSEPGPGCNDSTSTMVSLILQADLIPLVEDFMTNVRHLMTALISPSDVYDYQQTFDNACFFWANAGTLRNCCSLRLNFA